MWSGNTYLVCVVGEHVFSVCSRGNTYLVCVVGEHVFSVCSRGALILAGCVDE